MTLRVMTWNVWGRHGDWEARHPAIVEVLRANEPDVVCLQESWADAESLETAESLQIAESLETAESLQIGAHRQPALFAEALGGYSYAWGEGPWFNGRWLGNAVLSRWPIVRSEVHSLPRLDGGPPYRQLVIAWIDSPWGPWPVASTHFEHRFDGSAARRLHAETLLRIVGECRGDPTVDPPMIIGGDLNAVPDSDEVRLLTGRTAGVGGLVLSDVWEHVGAGGRDGTEGVTWRADNAHTQHSAWPNRRLDYLLVTWPRPRPVGNPVRAWLAGTERVDGVQPSDHAAVVADLVTP